MVRSILIASLLGLLVQAGGCLKVDARAPQSYPGMEAPPAASIPAADPTSKADLLRENQQLRDRVAYLESRNTRSASKSGKLDTEKQDLRNEMDKVAAERDRYRRAAK